MRRLLLAAAVFGSLSATAHAADLPDLPVLRGGFSEGLSRTSHNWDGTYFGVSGGYSADSTDFSQSVVGLTNYIFRDSVLQQPTANWSLLNKTNTQSTTFSGFVGRNWQWYDAILSLEGTYAYYNGLSTLTSGSNSLTIVNPPGDTHAANVTDNYDVTLTGTAAAKIKDMISLRGRVGWDGGSFMPYAFAGAAVGRMDVSRSVTSKVDLRQDVTNTTIDAFGVVTTTTTFGAPQPVPAQSQSMVQRRANAFAVGWTAGLGVEYCIWDGLFARVEYEYVKFSPVMNTSVTLNNARIGVGYKF